MDERERILKAGNQVYYEARNKLYCNYYHKDASTASLIKPDAFAMSYDSWKALRITAVEHEYINYSVYKSKYQIFGIPIVFDDQLSLGAVEAYLKIA